MQPKQQHYPISSTCNHQKQICKGRGAVSCRCNTAERATIHRVGIKRRGVTGVVARVLKGALSALADLKLELPILCVGAWEVRGCVTRRRCLTAPPRDATTLRPSTALVKLRDLPAHSPEQVEGCRDREHLKESLGYALMGPLCGRDKHVSVKLPLRDVCQL